MRTEYWNLSTNTVRGDVTTHGESLTDVDNHLLLQAQIPASSLYTWGVADGPGGQRSPEPAVVPEYSNHL